MPESVMWALELLGAAWLLTFSVIVGWTIMRRDRIQRPTPEQWDLAMANALDMASSLELEICEDPREMVLGCLRRQMPGAELAPDVRAVFAAAALTTIDHRRQVWGMRPLEYALTGYDDVPPGARVYRGHPDGLIAETLYEEQLRLKQQPDDEGEDG